jgi:hypothetical protein
VYRNTSNATAGPDFKIVGATSSTSFVDSVPSSGTYYYWIQSTNMCASSGLGPAGSITPTTGAPTIQTQPQNHTVCPGLPVTFTVNASGGLLSFQWRKHFNNIPGANSSNYTINAAGASDADFYDVIISNACGQTQSAPATLTVNPPGPLMGGISPNSAGTGSGSLTIQVTGAGFTPATTAQWIGSPLQTVYLGPTQLQSDVPAAYLQMGGMFAITLLDPSNPCASSGSAVFTVVNPAPAVSSVSPGFVTAGGPQFSLLVNGSGFVPNSAVLWKGVAVATSYGSSAQLNATIPASLTKDGGFVNISVVNPAPGGGTSAPVQFVIKNPIPVVSGLSPSHVSEGSAQFTMTVTGSSFVPSSVVRWNSGNLATAFVSSSSLTSTVPSSLVAAAGTANVTVFSPAPDGGTSNVSDFTIDVYKPILLSISPETTLAGGGAFTLTLNGAQFNNTSVAQWNGSPLSTTFVNMNKLTASVAASQVNTSGVGIVTVTNQTPSVQNSGSQGFIIGAALSVGAASTSASGSAPNAIVVADFNFDGNPDLMIANASPAGVAVALGNGAGGFGALAQFTTGSTPRAIALIDLNHDRELDAIVVGSSGGLAVLLGNGAGGFGAPASVAAPGALAIVTGDFNLDGNVDVVTSNGSANSLSFFAGNGAGALGAPTTTTLSGPPSALVQGDINSDGILDVLAVNTATNSVLFGIGLGTGGFSAGTSYTNFGGGAYTLGAIALGDVNADGLLDLAAALGGPQTSNGVGIAIGNGMGGFGSFTKIPLGGGGQQTMSGIAIAELNDDGFPDLVATQQSGNSVRYTLGNGTGSFGTLSTLTGVTGPKALAIADVNADGRVDILTANSANVVMFLNQTATPPTGMYGTGTPGCLGTLSIGFNSPPKINNEAFAILFTNAPPRSLGVSLITDAQDVAGTDPFGIGVNFQVDLLSAAELYSLNIYTSENGCGIMPASIPNNPGLAGKTYYAQGIFVESSAAGLACSTSPYHIVASRGAVVTLLP